MAPERASGDPPEPPAASAGRAGSAGAARDDPHGAARTYATDATDATDADATDEHCGEVELARYRKEDGRALILYRWRPDGGTE
ncbi:MAG TPA: hypothetical protein VL972_03395 [Solirubrobacteraceae bacterium]|nr:hypothetical protein [Solirubrobacteraceae bacterium]